MKALEDYFASHKLFFLVFIILASPFMLAWSLVYGLIIGIIGPTVDIFEIIRDRNYRDIRGLVKYPKWKAEDYKERYLHAAESGPKSLYEKEVEAFESGKKKAPGKIGFFLQNIFVFIIFYYPPMLLWGIMTGPIRAFLDYFKWCYKIWTGHWLVPF